MVQFRTRSSTVVGLFSQPLRANFDPTAAGLATTRPVGPLTQFAVRRTGDDASLLNVPCNQSYNNKPASVLHRLIWPVVRRRNGNLDLVVWLSSDYQQKGASNYHVRPTILSGIREPIKDYQIREKASSSTNTESGVFLQLQPVTIKQPRTGRKLRLTRRDSQWANTDTLIPPSALMSSLFPKAKMQNMTALWFLIPFPPFVGIYCGMIMQLTAERPDRFGLLAAKTSSSSPDWLSSLHRSFDKRTHW